MSEPPSPEAWGRARDLLSDALERPLAERSAFLDEACSDDPALRAELDALLEAHHARGPIDELADAVSGIVPPGDETQVGRRIGPYRIVRVIDHGGMGAVYLAEREDGQFVQRVALKLIRLGMHSDQVVRRFLEERQILARLEHPNIARLLEGGIAENAQPYFAMEYVEGMPITRYCDTHCLDLGRRLQLFRQVCAAVQYAHQNLVVHRDLKPSNILVTAAGVVKLLDFGIAKLLAQDAAPTDTAATTLRWLTPEYAAPEQVRGAPITTSADVYALGLLLYELLTGQRAHRWSTGALVDLERTICEVEPERPSDAIGRASSEDISRMRGMQPKQLQRAIAGDLDTIVLQALRKEPTLRYASAAQLNEDIERYRAGLPVRARPSSLRYRTAKFVQRHRAGVSAAALVVISLVGGIAATTWQAQVATEQERLARDERDRARTEAAKAEQVSAFVVDLFRASDPRDPQGDTVTARELLQRGLTQIERDLSAQPILRASMLDVIGRVYRNLGRYDQTEEVWREALALRRAALGARHPEVALTLTRLGLLHHQMARYQTAEPLLREALQLWTDHLHRESEDLATVLSNLGEIHMTRGESDQAIDFYHQALAMRRRVVGPQHPAVARDLSNLGMVLLHRDPATADTLFEQALTMQRELLPPDHADLILTLDGLAAARFRAGALGLAESLYREALGLRRQLLGPGHPEIAFSLESLGAVLEKKGDLAAAEALYRESLDLKRKLYGEAHVTLARPLTNLGRVLQARGECAPAQPLLREALAIRRRYAQQSQIQISELEKALTSCAARTRGR